MGERDVTITRSREDAKRLYVVLTNYLFAGQRVPGGPWKQDEQVLEGLRDEIDAQLGEGWWDEERERTEAIYARVARALGDR